MRLTAERENGVLAITADTYRLNFASDRPFVYLDDGDGARLAELFVLSSVHPLHDRDETTRIGTWQVTPATDEVVFSLDVESSVWQRKRYVFRCLPYRFTYEIEVEGNGRLAEANYLGGYFSGQRRWGSGFFWSGHHFRRGLTPEPNAEEQNYFSPAAGATIDLMGVPLPSKANWFFTPPPFHYTFQGAHGWLGIGVEGAPGSHRYTEFAYRGQLDGFHLALSFEGHTQVKGHYRLPALGFDLSANQNAPLAAHVAQFHPSPGAPQADWWRQPILCGWGAQCYLAKVGGGSAGSYATQETYQEIIRTLEANGVCPGTVVLDDKWQATYGENCADPRKWRDLPGFIAQQHAVGRKVLLWLQAWGVEGLPVEETITNGAGLSLACDPTNPTFEKRLRASVQRMLCDYDADGFKVDFTARIPSGPSLKTFGDAWGLELMRLYLGILYDEAKNAKRDALVMTHTPHPYLSSVTDMIRLNDMNTGKDIRAAMRLRARIASMACPHALIDTDNWPITDKTTWRDYMRLQPELGIPSLYYATHIDTTQEPLDAEDYALVRETWARYRAKLA